MRDGGVVVGVIPRSFCNGPYYRPFRQLMLGSGSLDHVHVFESRSAAFKDDDVLQENVIIKFVKGKRQGDVSVSWSHSLTLADYSEKKVAFEEVVNKDDGELFIRLPTHKRDVSRDQFFTSGLDELGLEVSTGPVVDFRLRAYWESNPNADTVPLIYPHHFSTGAFQYPKPHKKPNALRRSSEVLRCLMPNEFYVLVKRFSSKEERRRVVAYVMDPNDVGADKIGFENHWNVFHFHKSGIDPLLARGLACFLNSTDLDQRFRLFSGHTQVNATDLRSLRYPTKKFLTEVGSSCRVGMTQAEIDSAIAERQ